MQVSVRCTASTLSPLSQQVQTHTHTPHANDCRDGRDCCREAALKLGSGSDGIQRTGKWRCGLYCICGLERRYCPTHPVLFSFTLPPVALGLLLGHPASFQAGKAHSHRSSSHNTI